MRRVARSARRELNDDGHRVRGRRDEWRLHLPRLQLYAARPSTTARTPGSGRDSDAMTEASQMPGNRARNRQFYR